MSGGAPNTNFFYNPQKAYASRARTTGYNPSVSDYAPSQAMQGAVSQFGQLGDTMQTTAQQLMSGQSPFLQQQRQSLMQGLGDIGAQQSQAQSRMLASRGMGSGGLRSALNTGQASALGEQARRGLLGIAGQGMQQGLGMLGQMYGQTGQMATRADSNALQTALANMSAQNQASQFEAQSRNQAASQFAQNQLQAGLANQQAFNQAAEFGRTGNYNQAMNQQARQDDMLSNFGAIGSMLIPF